MAEPPLEVAQGVLVGDELDAARPAVGVEGTEVVGGVGVGVAPDVLVAGVGEGVLHVELELVDLPARQPVDEGDERLGCRHPVARHVEHDAAHGEVGPVLDAAGGQGAASPAPLGSRWRGVAQLGQGGAAVASAGVVGADEPHGVVGDLQAVALGRQGAVEGLGTGAVGDTAAVGREPRSERGRGSRIGLGCARRRSAGWGRTASGTPVPGSLGRSPCADHEGQLVRTTGRSSAWVTPMQRPGPAMHPDPAAPSARRRPQRAIMSPTTSGRSTSVSIGRRGRSGTAPSGASRGWAGGTAASSTGQIDGWNPQRFIDTGVSPGSSLRVRARRRPSKVPSASPGDHPPLHQAPQVSVGARPRRCPGSPGRR